MAILVNFKLLKSGKNNQLVPLDHGNRKKFENMYREGENMQVSYNSPPQKPSFSEFKDHNVGWLAFHLPTPRQLTHFLYVIYFWDDGLF